LQRDKIITPKTFSVFFRNFWFARLLQ
jgi:hypothetical protein